LKFGIRDRMIHARPALNDFLFPNPTAPRTAASSFALRAMFIVQVVFHDVNAIWDIGTLFFGWVWFLLCSRFQTTLSHNHVPIK
jgi:hypothetical protein